MGRTTLRLIRRLPLKKLLLLLRSDEGQAIAEYAVVLAVILVLVVSTVRIVGGNSDNVFSTVGSALTQ
jgi:Flp pilus assembly pilin Flp